MSALESPTGNTNSGLLRGIPQSLLRPLRPYDNNPQALHAPPPPVPIPRDNQQQGISMPALAPSPIPNGPSSTVYKPLAMAPPPPIVQYYSSGSVPPGLHESALQQVSPSLHPAIRPQFGTSWRQSHNAVLPQAGVENGIEILSSAPAPPSGSLTPISHDSHGLTAVSTSEVDQKQTPPAIIRPIAVGSVPDTPAFTDVPADSTTLVEQMMVNLRRASQTQSNDA